MSASIKTRIAVVGVGALGRHHARILSQMPDAELVAVSDPHVPQAQTVAESCGCDWTADYRTLLNQVDAVSIVVPTHLHKSIAQEFLSRGIPVMVEKPLTASVEEGELLVRLAEEQQIALQVGHIERFNPAFQVAAERVRNPKYIRCERLSPYAFRSMDISAVHDLMIHDIELTLALVGENPSHVEAFGVTLVGGLEDCVQARLKFPGGCIADLTANRVSPGFSRNLTCWSETGCVVADLHARKVTCFSPGQSMRDGELPYELAVQRKEDVATMKPEIFTRFIQTEEVHGSDEDALTAELRSFLACVRTGQTPLVSGHQGLAALKVAEQILKSVRSHAWDGDASGRHGPDALLAHYLPQTPSAKDVA